MFRDIDTLEAGEDFERAIEDAIAEAAAVLIVIGPRWVSGDGMRRLDDAHDYVRREIELGLESDSVLIPLLVDGAAAPKAEELPASIRVLHTRNAFELSHQRWQGDIEALIRHLEALGVSAPAGGGARTTGAAAAAPQAGRAGASLHGALRPIAQFLPNLFSLIRHPRQFLRQHARGRGVDLAAAFTFFVLAVICALAVILTAYDPVHSAFGLGVAAVVVGLVAVLALSGPLWIGWRLVGARRHYGKVLVLLLYQAGALHIVSAFAGAIVLFGFDLSARDVVSETIAEFMRPGQGAQGGFDTMRERIGPVADASEVRIALLASTLIALAGGAWLVASWGAYRDILGLGRLRALAAMIVAALVMSAVLALFGLVR